MIKNLTVFANDKERMQFASIGYYLKDSFINNFNCYKKYKSNLLDGFSEDTLQDMEVLEFLERLGFSIEESGTILYKNMIIKAMHHLNGTDDFGKSISRDQLLQQMKNPFSQFYVEVARSDLDIGIKTFHANVQQAVENVRLSNSDTALLFDVYSNFSKNTNYGEAALIIAEYMTGIKQNQEKPVIKQITMLPINNIKVSN